MEKAIPIGVGIFSTIIIQGRFQSEVSEIPDLINPRSVEKFNKFDLKISALVLLPLLASFSMKK